MVRYEPRIELGSFIREPTWWQIGVVEYLLSEVPQESTPAKRNTDHGLRIYWGKSPKMSEMADWILMAFREAVLIVPTSTPPFSDQQRHTAAVRRAMVDHPEVEDALTRIWVSRPLEIEFSPDKVTVQDVVMKNFQPLMDAEICVVDGASRLSRDELYMIRSAPWERYVELS